MLRAKPENMHLSDNGAAQLRSRAVRRGPQLRGAAFGLAMGRSLTPLFLFLTCSFVFHLFPLLWSVGVSVCVCRLFCSCSFLLWFRSTLMVNFAILCSDITHAIQWKQTEETKQTLTAAAGERIAAKPVAGAAAESEKTAAATRRSKTTVDASTQLPSLATELAAAGPAAGKVSLGESDRKTVPLSGADAAGKELPTIKTEGHRPVSGVDSGTADRLFPPFSSIALLPIQAEIKPEAALAPTAAAAAASESERKESAAQ